MKSWDFFDTLLGRACGEPWRVFELMGGDSFKKVRQHAERISNKSFDGIYESMKCITGWSSEEIDRLKKEEMSWEYRLAFPIVDNLKKVSQEDIIITDTYFNADQIRVLGKKIGMPCVNIHASYGGKHSESIWKKFKDEGFNVDLHTGDNRHSDYDMAKKYGTNASWYNEGGFSATEQNLQKAGHWDVAGLVRCVRLQNPYEKNTPQWQAYDAEASLNIPILMFFSCQLKQYFLQNKIKRAFFLSRDALLLKKVFSKLFPDFYVDTFFSSRQTLYQPSESYIKYAESCAKMEGSVFVDIQGTGTSAMHFKNKTGISMQYIFCMANANAKTHVPFLYKARRFGTQLEVLNYDTSGRVIDVVDGVPIRDEVEYDLSLVEAQHKAIDRLLEYIFKTPNTPSDKTILFVFNNLQFATKELVNQHVVLHKNKF
jgi:predicted HAD superfamily hydrolase